MVAMLATIAHAGELSLSVSQQGTPWHVGKITHGSTGLTNNLPAASFLVTVSNTVSASTNVSLQLPLPKGFFPEIVAAEAGGFTCSSTEVSIGQHTVSCTGRDMAVDEAVTVRIPVWLDQLATSYRPPGAAASRPENTFTISAQADNAALKTLPVQTEVEGVANVVAASSCEGIGGIAGPNLFTDGSFGNLSSGVAIGRTNAVSNNGPVPPAGVTTLTHAGDGSVGDGKYRITNRLANQLTVRDATWYMFVGDHTTLAADGGKGDPSGLMMVINANLQPAVFYEKVVTVAPHTSYEFSLWVAHANNPAAAYWKNSIPERIPLPANLEFVVDRIGVDDDNDGTVDEPGEEQVLITTGDIGSSDKPVWRQFASMFFSGEATSVRFRFRNNGEGGDGNDLAIDDLTLATCAVVPRGAVSGVLYLDENGNGALDSAELVRLPADVTLQLVDTYNVVVATAVTDAAGAYSFTGIPTLPSADYKVKVLTSSPSMPAQMALSTLDTLNVTVVGGSTVANQNFGFTQTRLLLGKAWNNAVVGDEASVQVARAGTVLGSFVSQADTASETDTATTAIAINAGEVLDLSEVLTGTGQYVRSLSCDKGTLNEATLTVAAAVGEATTCTFTNRRVQSALSITKTNGVVSVSPGDLTTYTITVTNTGPDAVTGAVVADTPSAGLTCSAAATVVCTGAACPAGALTMANLAAGVTLGALPATTGNNSVSLSVPCSVN